MEVSRDSRPSAESTIIQKIGESKRKAERNIGWAASLGLFAVGGAGLDALALANGRTDTAFYIALEMGVASGLALGNTLMAVNEGRRTAHLEGALAHYQLANTPEARE